MAAPMCGFLANGNVPRGRALAGRRGIGRMTGAEAGISWKVAGVSTCPGGDIVRLKVGSPGTELEFAL